MKNLLKTCLVAVAVCSLVVTSQPSRARAAGTYPVVVAAPVMTNTTETGANRNMDVLSVTTGTWTNAASYAYTWWRCRWVMADLKAPIGPGLNEVTDPTATGNSGYTYSRYNIVNWQVACTRIGATGSTYEIQGADIGSWVGATVAATSPSGLVNNMSANWSAKAVTAAPPVLVTPITGQGLSVCTGYTSSPCLKAESTWKGVQSYGGWQGYECPTPTPTDFTQCVFTSWTAQTTTYLQIGGTDYCFCVAAFYPAYKVLVQTVYGYDLKPYTASWSYGPILGRAPLTPQLIVRPGDGVLNVYVNPTQGDYDRAINGWPGDVYPAKTITVKVPGQADCVINLSTAKKSPMSPGYACTFSSLTNGNEYSVSAFASNAAGDSGIATATGTPNLPPGPPTNVVTVASNKSLTITWSPPTSGTIPTSYVVWNPNTTGLPACTIDMTAIPTPPLTCTITGLTNGTDYTFNVVSQTSSGYATTQTHGIPTAGSPATNVKAPTVVDQAGNQPPHVGDALTLSSGEWTTATATFAYQWYSCSTASTAPATDPNCSVVTGATASTYSPTAADLGKYFTGVVTATGRWIEDNKVCFGSSRPSHCPTKRTTKCLCKRGYW